MKNNETDRAAGGEERQGPAFANTEFVPPEALGEAEAQAAELAELGELSAMGVLEDAPTDPTPDAALPSDSNAPDVLTDIAAAEASGSAADKPTLSHIGRYALKERLAVGGLGAVYEAWDPLLSRTVAVKTLQFDVDTPSRVSLDGLFLNEARTAAGLAHRGIVTVHDAGLSAHGVYIAMERLVGHDLRQALAQGWRPSPLRAALLARRVADALAYAHGQGVVHCDIKPANIFLTAKLRPKVLDFGIARAAGARSAALQGLVAGSPHYLAPEQLLGGEINERTDVYSLGVVLYELLAGRKAFDGESLDAITAAVLHAEVPPAHRVRMEVPLALSLIVTQAMARDPAARLAGAAALATALRGWIEAQIGAARGAAGHASSTSSASVSSEAPGGAALHPGHVQRAGRKRIALTFSAALGGLALATFLLRPASETVSGSQALESPSTAPIAATAAPSTTQSLFGASEPPGVSTLGAGSLAAAAATATPVTAAASGAQPAATTARNPATSAPTRPAREARQVRQAVAPTAAPPAPAAQQGAVRFAITPWGEVDVNGTRVGTTPPMTMILLPIGEHQVVVRNADAPPYTTIIQVEAEKPAVVRHRFGP